MKSNQENELIMEEITVKNLQEISGGATNLSSLTTSIGAIIDRPIMVGMISRPKLPIVIKSLK